MENNIENIGFIVLTVKGVIFLFTSAVKLNKDSKNRIRSICDNAFEEDSSFNLFLKKLNIDIDDVSVYEIADIFKKIVKEETNIDMLFKAVDLELSIDE